nr:uncharacterized protein LOC128699922 [Cherax quadricarinatus]
MLQPVKASVVMVATFCSFLLLFLVQGVLAQNNTVVSSVLPHPSSYAEVKASDENITGVLNELNGFLIRMESILNNNSDITKQLATVVIHQFNCSEQNCCPYPYTRVLDECFYLSLHSLHWYEAREHCQGMSGDLASPKHIDALKTYIINTAGLYIQLIMCNKNTHTHTPSTQFLTRD